jgi:hypothetical protein
LKGDALRKISSGTKAPASAVSVETPMPSHRVEAPALVRDAEAHSVEAPASSSGAEAPALSRDWSLLHKSHKTSLHKAFLRGCQRLKPSLLKKLFVPSTVGANVGK